MNRILIENLTTIIVDLPTIRRHKLAMHTLQNQTLMILRLRCSDGIEGAPSKVRCTWLARRVIGT